VSNERKHDLLFVLTWQGNGKKLVLGLIQSLKLLINR